MKIEEAVNIVQGARQYLMAGNPIWDVKKVDEAMKMAIVALQEEQTAEWIQPTSSEDSRRLDIRFVRCSKCGEQQIVIGHKGYNELPFNYCPNCRAKMSLQKRAEFTRSYSCDPDDYGTMCEWCQYNDGSKCIKPMKGGEK